MSAKLPLPDTVRHEQAFGAIRWRITEQWRAEGVDLEGFVEGPYVQEPGPYRCRIRVAGGVEATFEQPRRPPAPVAWTVVRSLPACRLDDDAVGLFLSRLATVPFRWNPYRSRRGLPEHLRFIVPIADAIHQRLYAMVPEARRKALRLFPSAHRFALLEAFDRDPTGRLLEHARREPGVLLLLTALQRQGQRSAADRLATLLAEGHKLNAAIDATLEAALPKLKTPQRRAGRDLGPAYARIDALPPEERRAALQRWRLLVRRARHHVTPELLLRPPPLDLAPEDIPRSVADNARWFAGMACHDAIVDPQAAGDLETGRRYARFVSANGWRMPVFSVTRWALDYVRAHPELDPRRLTRSHLIERLIEFQTRAAALPALPLPPPPVAGTKTGALEVWPLESAEEMDEESRVMGHCAGSYVGKVRERTSFLYGARAGRERLTVELSPDESGRWRMVQVKGPRNVLPTPAALAALAGWSLDPTP